MFAWNIFRPLYRDANDWQVQRAMRVALVVISIIATVMAIGVQSVYTLWYLSADLVYVILFPQMVLGLFDRRANSIGALSGAVVGLTQRMFFCDPSPLRLPWLPEDGLLLTRTCAMLTSLATIWLVSRLTGRWDPPAQLD
jgi:high affinity choline transporter 7